MTTGIPFAQSRTPDTAIRYDDPEIARLHERIGALIEGDAMDAEAIGAQLHELAIRNNPRVAAYWRHTGTVGVPDVAFRERGLFHFADAAPVRVFRTSGTSGSGRGHAAYSALGLDLMNRSVIANARRHLFTAAERPAVIRLVPDPANAPDSIMAYGMALLAETFGDPIFGACVVGPGGLDLDRLVHTLHRAVAEERPVVMIGGSFAYLHVADAMAERRRSWRLPAGSRVVDAGGFKGRSRILRADDLRARLQALFGIDTSACLNLFGMTELASQIYDSGVDAIGPNGERPKAGTHFVRPRLRDPKRWDLTQTGTGILEVEDFCVIDRPCRVLTGDWGIGTRTGVAIVGRFSTAESRGCALAFEAPDVLRPTSAQEISDAAA